MPKRDLAVLGVWMLALSHSESIAHWEATLERQRAALLQHPLHCAITSPTRLRFFVEHHVYCVFDFMSLLKSLQRDLTCVASIWTPPRYPQAARLINEIVVGEESDEVSPGRFLSHFAWYIEAMDELGANTAPIRLLIRAIETGMFAEAALETTSAPKPARHFVLETLRVLRAPLTTRLAVFFFARENVIPGLFLPLVQRLAERGLSCDTLVAYLQRHIDVDGGSHGPMARQLLAALLNDMPDGTEAAYREAARALDTRRKLWDEMYDSLSALP